MIHRPIVAPRQPRGLSVLFMAELFERFGFYAVLSLLVLYATQSLGMTDDRADLLFGSYIGLSYAMTVAGGILADRILGFRNAVMLGTLIMAFGHAVMAIGTETMLLVGLSILIVGLGLFKPNVASLLGTLYRDDDPRRENGFMTLYVGTNAGAFLGILIAGFLSESLGYPITFLLAGFMRLVAFAILLRGRSLLENDDPASSGHPSLRTGLAGASHRVWFSLGLCAAVLAGFFLLRHGIATGVVLLIAGPGFFLAFAIAANADQSTRQKPLYALLILLPFTIVFWMVYSQSSSSVVLFIERSVDRVVFGYSLPASSFVSLNPLFIVLLAPIFVWLWIRLAARGIRPSEAFKFALGLLLVGAAFFALRLPAWFSSLDTPIAPGWMVAFFILLSCGELCLSPVGQSLVSRLSPPRLLGFAMGLWYLFTAFADYVSGWLARLAAVPDETPTAATYRIYEAAFVDYGLIAIVGGALLLLLLPTLNRLMR